MITPTASSSELFGPAMQMWEATLQAGLRIQEESARQFTEMLTRFGMPRQWQKQAQKIFTEAVHTAQANMEEAIQVMKESGKRNLDLFQKAIEQQHVLLNGLPVKASKRLRVNDRLSVRLPDVPDETLAPEDVPLDVLYEDDALVLINKPADMVVHPAKGHWTGTLVNALRHRFPQLSGLNGDYRAGIVHRLDRDTSGVILVAKEEQTHRDLALLFEHRKVFKEYLAITAGILDRDSDYIEGRIAHHKLDRIKERAERMAAAKSSPPSQQ